MRKLNQIINFQGRFLPFYSATRKVGSLVFLAFVLNIQFSSAQDLNSDSLIRVLKKHSELDTGRVNLLNKISSSYLKSEMAKATSYVNRAEKLSEKLNYSEGLGDSQYIRAKLALNSSKLEKAGVAAQKALVIYKKAKAFDKYSQAYNAIAVVNIMTGQLDRAKKNLLRCIAYHDKYNDTDNSDCAMNLGSLYGHLGDIEKSIEYFEKAKEEKIEFNSLERISACYLNIGVSNERLGKLANALENFLQAYRIDKKDGNKLDLISSSIAIGRIYHLQKEFDKASKYYKESIRLSREFDDKVNVGSGLINLGVIEFEKGEYKNAEKYYRRALQTLEKTDDKRHKSIVNHKLGQVLVEVKKYDEGLKYYRKAIEFGEESPNNPILASIYLGLGGVLKDQGKFDEALNYFILAEKMAKDHHLGREKQEVFIELSDLYEHRNNHMLALKYFKAHHSMKDSIYNEESIRKIAQLESENLYVDSLKSLEKRGQSLSKGLEKADVDKALAEKSRLRYIIGSLVLIIVLIGIIFFMTFRNSRQKIKNITVEQKLLRTQMTPHFIFNSLGIVQGMILNKEYNKSLDYLSNFSVLMRSTLENSRDKMVLLEKELAVVMSYVNLQNSTIEDPYDCEITLDNSVDASSIFIPPMLIQPFVENSIEHGFKDKTVQKKIQITIQFDNKDLVCVIADNGIGINHIREEKDNPKTSMATNITKDRLKILAKEYKVNTGFSIVDRRVYSEQGTTVTIILPYKNLSYD